MRSSLGRSKLRRLAWRYHCLQMAQTGNSSRINSIFIH